LKEEDAIKLFRSGLSTENLKEISIEYSKEIVSMCDLLPLPIRKKIFNIKILKILGMVSSLLARGVVNSHSLRSKMMDEKNRFALLESAFEVH
jgi:hypothetical protein